MLNNVVLMGRLAQKPEIKNTQTGKAVTRFDLAVPVPSADRNAEPDYIPIVCWEKQAEFVGKYLDKGRQVTVKGKIKTQKFKDRDGKTRKDIYVKAEEVYFADSKTESGADQQTEPSAPTFEDVKNDDDLPF